MKRGGAIDKLRAICLALPEAEEKPFGGHTSPCFRVRDKIFVMVAEDQQTMSCKAPPGAQGVLVGAEPDRFFVPRYTGKNGWIGMHLKGALDWEHIADLVRDSYRMTAPKKLLALMP